MQGDDGDSLTLRRFFKILFSSLSIWISCINFITMPSCSFSMASKASVSSAGVNGEADVFMLLLVGESDSVAMLLSISSPVILLLLLLLMLRFLRWNTRLLLA